MTISSNVWVMCIPSRLPDPLAHFAQPQSSRGAGVTTRRDWQVSEGGGLRAGGSRVAVAGAGGGGRVLVATGTRSVPPFVGRGGCGHWTAVADLVALEGVGAALVGVGAGGRVRVARGAGSVAPFLGGGGWGHGTLVTHVEALGEAGAAGAGPWGVVAASQGAEAVRVGPGGGLGAVASWGTGQLLAVVLCRGGARALSFVGAGFSVGRVRPLLGRRWRLGRLTRWWWVLGGAERPSLSTNVPRMGVVPDEGGVLAAAAGGTGPVAVGGVVPAVVGVGGVGLLRLGRGGRADIALGRRGGPWW